MRSAPAIAFDYRPSRRLAVAAGLLAALAVLCVLLSGLPIGLRALLVVAVPLHALVTLRRFLAPPWVRIAHDAGGWRLVDRAGEAMATTLAGHVRLGPLLVLDFATPERPRFHCVLTPDVSDADTRRRLHLVLARGSDASTA
ncbi:MAG: hypothetical protein J0L88_04475 [Xanthomonadales bacterium]|nr:hypothetical protein [Xanthomonadales bacterium]